MGFYLIIWFCVLVGMSCLLLLFLSRKRTCASYIKIKQNTPLFYINLDDNIKRRDNIINLTNRLGFNNVIRFPAVNTKTLEKVSKYKDMISKFYYDELVDYNINKMRKHNYQLTNGAVGCYLSFISIFKKILENNMKYALIFEDDLQINCDKQTFWKIISNLRIPSDTDVFLLHGLYNDPLRKLLQTGIHRINFFYCTTCMLVTNQGAKKLLEHLLPIEVQIDTALSRLSYDRKINLYGLKEPRLDIDISNMGSDVHVGKSCKTCNTKEEIESYKNRSIKN